MSDTFTDWVHSEIQYMTPTGSVHSDFEPADRATLHKALDEWLDQGNGSGFFYVGDVRDLREEFGGQSPL